MCSGIISPKNKFTGHTSLCHEVCPVEHQILGLYEPKGAACVLRLPSCLGCPSTTAFRRFGFQVYCFRSIFVLS